MFDATIRISDLFVGLTMLLGGYGAFLSMQNHVKTQESKLAEIQVELKKQTDILVAVARQDERLTAVEAQLRAIRWPQSLSTGAGA